MKPATADLATKLQLFCPWHELLIWLKKSESKNWIENDDSKLLSGGDTSIGYEPEQHSGCVLYTEVVMLIVFPFSHQSAFLNICPEHLPMDFAVN